MEAKNIAKQIIDFQKTLLDNTYHATVQLQDNGEKMTHYLLDQQPHLPAQAKTAVVGWLHAARQGRETMKQFQDENLNRLEEALCPNA